MSVYNDTNKAHKRKRDILELQARLHLKIAKLSAQRDDLLYTLSNTMQARSLLPIESASQSGIPSEHASEEQKDILGEATKANILREARKLQTGHIQALKDYNEIKDVGQTLLGIIAEQRGVRVVEVMAEFDLKSDD